MLYGSTAYGQPEYGGALILPRLLTVSVNDTFTIVEVFLNGHTALKSFIDSFTISDSIATVKPKLFSALEHFSISESIIRAKNGIFTIASRRVKPVTTWIKRIKP